MKKIALFSLCSLVLFILISSQYSTSARLLPATQDEQKTDEEGEIAQATSTLNPLEEDIASLMGMEECKEKDEDCLKRRMVAEAHLDYIYTQRNKPNNKP